MKKFILILSLSLSLSINAFSYNAPLKANGMKDFIEYFDDYFSNPYWNVSWSSFSYWVPWDFTGNVGDYFTILGELSSASYANTFDALTTAKQNGTLTSDMIAGFYDMVYDNVVQGSIVSKPIVSDLPANIALCAGYAISTEEPAVIDNGATITSEGWQIETSVGSGSYTNISGSYTPSTSDHNKKVKYYATNSKGTSTSNLATLQVTASPTITASTSNSRCGAGNVNLSATASAGSVKWYTAATGGSSIHTGTNYTASASTTTVYYTDATNNGCTTATRTAVTATINQTPAINDKAIEICSGESFNYTPLDATDGSVPTGTSYSWTAPSATNITGTTSQTDVASVNDILTNTGSSLQFVYYSVTPAVGSCYGTAFNVSVSVKPSPTVTVTDGYICGTGSANFVAESNIVGSSFNWFNNPTGGLSIATGSTYLTGNLSASTSYYVEAEYDGCKAASRTQASVLLIPTNSTWTGALSTDWNDAGNWTNGIPGACTKVNISQSPRYPDISGVLSNVACEKITFEPGTSIYGLEKLTYDSAQVMLDLKRNKWYMLTTPLKEMYSGDYYMEGAPVTSMKLFGTNTNASTGTNIQTVTGQWTNSFASLKEKLSPGEGFAYKIETTEWHYPTGQSAVSTDKTLTFPRTNTDGSLKTSATPISGVTGKLYPAMAQHMSKDATKAYRFAMEDETNQLASLIIPVKAGLNLIGNPLMSHLDFNSLYIDNNSLISNYVQFWNGSSFGSITTDGTVSGTSIEGLSLKIPPMKSFVVNALQDGNLVIRLTNYTPTGNVALKGATVRENTLYIESNNGLARSSSAVIMNPSASNTNDQKDVSKLHTQITEVPEVYTISGKKSLDINQFSSFPYIVPVGVKSGGADSVSLNFKGVESFEGVEVKLINTATSETQDLKENCTYCFKTDGSVSEGTLFLEFRSASATTETDELTNTNSGIQIFTGSNNSVNVLSSVENKALEILVYDPLGKLISRKTALSNTSESVTINHPGKVFIVKVVSEKGVETKKVVMD